MTVFMSESLIHSTVSTKKHKFIQEWSAVVGRQGQRGLLCWPYKKYNWVKHVFIDYLTIIFICVMSTKLSMISLVEAELEYPTYKNYAASTTDSATLLLKDVSSDLLRALLTESSANQIWMFNAPWDKRHAQCYPQC